ncbi:MAG TPA: hypothetical protein VFJ43_14070, partial [Bacteroidia bacterium]|nr:hypothetical protein [Bacteroidia bacterium]
MIKVYYHTSIITFLHRFIPVIVGMLFNCSAPAQNFNYSFSKDSVVWQELNSQTILNATNSAWLFSYKIPIGFSFNYLVKIFDSLKIETNGYIIFDEDRIYALSAFSGFGDCTDFSGNHSVLGYELSGNNGTRILKIQYKHVSNAQTAGKFFSYQIWLKENREIEIHIGPNDFHTTVNPLQAYRIGLLNMNMDTSTRGLFIGGNSSSP